MISDGLATLIVYSYLEDQLVTSNMIKLQRAQGYKVGRKIVEHPHDCLDSSNKRMSQNYLSCEHKIDQTISVAKKL